MVGAVVGAALLAAACSSSSPAGLPKLPVLGASRVVFDGDVGDPFVLHAGNRFIVYGTDDWPARVPTGVTSDLRTWAAGPDAMPALPGWAGADATNSLVWAPAVIALGGHFLLYITVPDRASGRQCIAVTESGGPLGPFRDAIGKPLVCQVALGGSIDPSVTRDATGLHLVWKSDGNCCHLPARLWEQDLASNGTTLKGNPHLLLTAGPSWQAGIIENPALLKGSRGWWLFYSGDRFDVAGYATGAAWCPSLEGPCLETSDGPFLAGTPMERAPGGLDFFTDGKGHDFAAFATWSRPPRNGVFYCCRPLSVAQVLSD